MNDLCDRYLFLVNITIVSILMFVMQIFPGELGETMYGCWRPGSWCHQIISSYGVDVD